MRCKFHPLDKAMNYCDGCEASYCESCSDESAAHVPRRSRADQIDHSCFVCDRPLEPLKETLQIPPFWTRLPEIYRYPLNIEAIFALLIVSTFTAFLKEAGIFLILPSVAMLLYSFACLRETAGGNLEAPGLEVCFEESIVPLIFVVIAILGLGAVAYNIFDLFGTGMGMLAFTFFILAVPVIIIIIAVEGSLLTALNPARLFSAIQATGTSYFVMVLFMMIMSSSVFVLISFFGVQSNSFIGVLLQSLVINYYGVVCYHIMGYLVYQNQEELGFHAKTARILSELRSDSVRQKVQLEMLIKAGDYQTAGDVARKQIKEPSANLWDWSRAFTLTCISGDSDETQAMFDGYASKLEAAGEIDKLSDAYLQLKKRHPTFEVQDHEQRLLVAKSLFETGQYPHVVNILHMFHQQSDDNSRITRALKLLSESLSSIPGRETLANQYETLYQLQLKKA